MQPGDWLNAAVNLAIGVLMGIALAYSIQLVSTGYGLMAVVTLVFVGGLLLFERLLDKFIEKVFPSGIRPARKPTKRPAPLPRRLSLPAGLVLGVVSVQLGWSEAILGLIRGS